MPGRPPSHDREEWAGLLERHESPTERERRQLGVHGVRTTQPALEQADPLDRERDGLQGLVEHNGMRRWDARERDVRSERAPLSREAEAMHRFADRIGDP